MRHDPEGGYFAWQDGDVQVDEPWGEGEEIPEIESDSDVEPPANDRASRLHRALDRALDLLAGRASDVWQEEEHPRRRSGEGGGQFAKKDEGGGGKKPVERTFNPLPMIPLKPYDESKFRPPTKQDTPPPKKNGEPGKWPAWEHLRINPDKHGDVICIGEFGQSGNTIRRMSKDYIERSLANQKKWPKWAQALKIPAEATHVALSSDPDAKIQAEFVDTTGHWKTVRNKKHTDKAADVKFKAVETLDWKMDKILNTVNKDLKSKDPETQQLALLFRVLEATGSRHGGDPARGEKNWDAPTVVKQMKEKWPPWARKLALPQYGSDGALDLEYENVQKVGGKVLLRFIAKESKPNEYEIEDPALAKLVWQAKVDSQIPRDDGTEGDFLFPDVLKKDLERYTKDLGIRKTYDLRTRVGCNRAKEIIEQLDPPETMKEFKAARKQIGEYVSHYLNNGPNQALKDYIDPKIIRSWAPKLFDQYTGAKAKKK